VIRTALRTGPRRPALHTGPLAGLTLAALAWLAPAPARAIETEALLDTLQRSAFQFFWSEANPSNGLIKDRNTSGSPSSIASIGFGLTAIHVGIDRGWVSRPVAANRVLTTLRTLHHGPQSSAASGTIGYQGWFYHFLDMNTATRFSSDVELSSIDTALLLAGVLDAGAYFDGADATEDSIRWYADTLYRRVNFNFMRNFNPGLLMGWKPGTGFQGYGEWVGYNEAMILYLLAFGSPTKPITLSAIPGAWARWTGGYDWETHYGQTYVRFEPLFGHQYSHCWIDFRNLRDEYMRGKDIDYFENSRRATLAQRAYSIDNPEGWVGYRDSLWGITASDDPFGYSARGAPPEFNDNGTIAPTAPFGSIPFAPEECIAVAHYLWDYYRPTVWGPYGFKDAFNPTFGWVDSDYIGIDQGPIVIMIENHRTGSVWQRFMQIPYIQTALERAGFQPWVLDAGDPSPGARRLAAWASPNPFRGEATVRFRLPDSGHVGIDVFDVHGRRVARLADRLYPAGEHAAPLAGEGLGAGVYLVRIAGPGGAATLRCVRLE
jgi:hypothetical protein